MAIIQGRQIDPNAGVQRFETDVVVVGSGAGGGPFAAELAEAGMRVMIVEEGGYYKTEDFTADAMDMVKKLYRNAGTTMAMGKPNVNLMEGQCVGGSTVINAGISWRTPDRILKAWRWEHDLKDVSPSDMAPHFDRVERRVHVAPQPVETYGGDAEIFKRGSNALDYRWMPVRRNQKHCVGTNNCIFGCPTGAKQSVLVTYIPDALQAGATLLSDCRIERIDHDKTRATGVRGYFKTAKGKRGAAVEIRAKHVVSACGALQTPALLQRSKIPDPHQQIGQHLMLHPNSKVVGIFEEDLKSWTGVVQGIQVTEFMEEGLLFGTTFVPPSVHVLTLPFWGAQAKELMSYVNNMVTGAVLVEDTDSEGRVRAGFGGEPHVTYALGANDYHRLRKGVAILSELYFAAGAVKVYLPFHNMTTIESVDEIPKIFDHDLKASDMEVLTVHAMCTARMGGDPRRSVTNGDGRVHTLENLYVSDASLFPGPIGVNPQITIMALATRNAERFLRAHGRELRA